MEQRVITHPPSHTLSLRAQIFGALARGRYQIAAAIALAICLPMIIRSFTSNVSLTDPMQYNTAIGSAAAIILGYISYRRIHVLPGISSGGYVITSLTAWFGILVLIFSMLRMSYTTIQLAASYSLSVIYLLFIHLYVVSRRKIVFGVVSSAATALLPEIGRVDWYHIPTPDSPLPRLEGVVVDLASDHSDAWSTRIAAFALEGIPVYHVRDAIENLTGMVEIRHLSENTLGSLNPNDVYFLLRRICDGLVAAMCLVAAAPFFCLVAIAIRMDSTGPVIFRQPRVGFRNRVFTVYKFRTMICNAGAVRDRDFAITVDNDPRITKVGRFLRKYRIDELPQLLNVLKGEMGLIGPRPEATPLAKWYELEIPFYHYRHIIKPGITGWAQVSQGHVSTITDVSQKLHLDFYYVKNFSFWLDVLIVLKTVRVMLRGVGAR